MAEVTCSACDYASNENPNGFYFRDKCPQCAARCLAQSVTYQRRNDGDAGKAAYLDALRKLEIADTAKAAHAHVEAWAEITKKGRRHGMRELDSGPGHVPGGRAQRDCDTAKPQDRAEESGP